ncbi:MAG TPA: hypothetical protein VNY51_03810 [Candidatus Dormibacteraeota bacterium]|jgi:hypothetical protein|nr:hypothetical protein [Candidatus Dormibacteraeota bacterium]
MQMCAFCLKPAKMSREHVWSAWVSRMYPEHGYHFDLRTLTASNEDKRWKSRSIDLTSKVVCEECNNTWMSDLETNLAKPAMSDMIQNGSSRYLLPSGIEAISTFAFKTAVIADHNRPRRSPFFSHVARKKFSQSLQIPNGVQIWLAHFVSQHLMSGKLTTYYAQIRSGRFRGFELYMMTFVVGHLIIQVSASHWASLAKRPKFSPQLIQNPEWNDAAVPIWPRTGFSPKEVVWPAALSVGDEQFEGFASRFAKLEEAVIRPTIVV